jgi:hypothetical protein
VSRVCSRADSLRWIVPIVYDLDVPQSKINRVILLDSDSSGAFTAIYGLLLQHRILTLFPTVAAE